MSEFNSWEVARSIPTLDEFAGVLDDYLNNGGKQYKDGLVVGRNLRGTHRTLQRQAIGFCLGIICGLSEQDHTDLRNEAAIETAKKIKEMYETGNLDIGGYL